VGDDHSVEGVFMQLLLGPLPDYTVDGTLPGFADNLVIKRSQVAQGRPLRIQQRDARRL
jgi:hypothetical protein